MVIFVLSDTLSTVKDFNLIASRTPLSIQTLLVFEIKILMLCLWAVGHVSCTPKFSSGATEYFPNGCQSFRCQTWKLRSAFGNVSFGNLSLSAQRHSHIGKSDGFEFGAGKINCGCPSALEMKGYADLCMVLQFVLILIHKTHSSLNARKNGVNVHHAHPPKELAAGNTEMRA